IAQLGLSNVWLQSGNLDDARLEAQAFLNSALSTADPYLQALAWDLKSRLAIAEMVWSEAHDFLERGLAITEQFDVPVAGWHLHATAWKLYRQTEDERTAENHRAHAERHILNIVCSFAPDEPLREIFLSATPVHNVLQPQERKFIQTTRRRKATVP